MTYVALDLSIASTGICIATECGECQFFRLTDVSYARDRGGHHFEKAVVNGLGIANAIAKLLMPYRDTQLHVGIESIGFGFLHGRATNSTTDLIFEQAIVASQLAKLFNASIQFIEPTKHKKLFTGNGKASKELSVAQMLHWFPQLTYCTDKLDDIADAMSIMTCMVSDIRKYTPSIRIC